ncbi:glutathione peroxidase [Aerophototrophica crusticola]|uniref:Glutathione peroxidase n=1 Tax=Aerophototrophica crusticola TaxID=1709002 RepID=A0A858R9V6_9PROT|nr:glutathione peroxidase [Rhodospirillaceae bacterium B3]
MTTAHAFSFPTLDGTGTIGLGSFAGKPVLVVNTASACGFTPQYKDLQALWDRYRERGLVVLGVPSNDFGGQEPGDAGEIGAFCERNYGVSFPLAAKQPVLGGDAHPFYRWLGEEVGEAALPKWNFHKLLLGPDGQVAGIFGPRVAPLSDELVAAVEALLPG